MTRRLAVRVIVLIMGVFFLYFSLHKMHPFHLSPEAVLEEYIKGESKTNRHVMQQKGKGYVEYFFENNKGVKIVRVRENRLVWEFEGSQSCGYVKDPDEDIDVYDLSQTDFDEKVTRIYGACQKEGTVKVKVVEENGRESFYDMDQNLFCVRVDDSVKGDITIYGLDAKNKELWKLGYSIR